MDRKISLCENCCHYKIEIPKDGECKLYTKYKFLHKYPKHPKIQCSFWKKNK